MIRSNGTTPLVITELASSPEEKLKALAEMEEFLKNTQWFSAHATEIRDLHAGKFICIAAQELFVGDDPVDVSARALAAHPRSGGFFTKRISEHRGPKIYANRWLLG
jgi:hypothetical protein